MNWRIERAEVSFERCLEDNPVYPFKKFYCENDPLYCYSWRIQYLHFGVLGLVISILGLIFYWLAGGEQPRKASYLVYRGRQLTHKGYYHNIYIRLLKKQTSIAMTKYYLVLDGWGLELPIILSRHTKDKSRLRQLALRLAQKLDLNYFDVDQCSSKHVILHHRPSKTYYTGDCP